MELFQVLRRNSGLSCALKQGMIANPKVRIDGFLGYHGQSLGLEERFEHEEIANRGRAPDAPQTAPHGH